MTNIFEQASRAKLRFDAPKGSLTVEDLWDLNLQSLNALAKVFNKGIKEEEAEDFLDENKESKGINLLKLKFDITLHILRAKQDEIKKAGEAEARKETKQKILAILEKKRDGALEEKSEEELIEELDKLG